MTYCEDTPDSRPTSQTEPALCVREMISRYITSGLRMNQPNSAGRKESILNGPRQRGKSLAEIRGSRATHMVRTKPNKITHLKRKFWTSCYPSRSVKFYSIKVLKRIRLTQQFY